MYDPMTARLYKVRDGQAFVTSGAFSSMDVRDGFVLIKASSLTDALAGIGETVHVCPYVRRCDYEGV
jgi:hypothetical protein